MIPMIKQKYSIIIAVEIKKKNNNNNNKKSLKKKLGPAMKSYSFLLKKSPVWLCVINA